MPKNASEIPPNASPDKGITPFFCLLEDDNPITKVSVVTDRLLRENFNQNDVSLVIHVVTKAVKAIWANIGLG